jgi:hypothetical protein
MRSDMSLKDWRGSLVMFDGFFDTRPALELDRVTWEHVVSVIAPEDGPAPVIEKDRNIYFISCSLKSAPLIGSTLAKALQQGLSSAEIHSFVAWICAARLRSENFLPTRFEWYLSKSTPASSMSTCLTGFPVWSR